MTASSSGFWLGVRTFAPVAISIAAYGLVWGVLAGQAGMSPFEVLAMSGLVFAGASQFVALEMWHPGALPIVSIVVATAIVNLRVLLMSATLRPLVAGLSWPKAMGAMFFVSDEQWAMTMVEVRNGRGSVGFLLGAGVSSWVAWVAATLIGRVLGAFIDDPTRYGLDFAFTATFIALLLGMWKGRGDLLPWLVSALVATGTAVLVPGNWSIITGGLAGAATGALLEMRKGRADVA